MDVMGNRENGFFSVLDFGALGNGTHDDTEAIQACFNEAQRGKGTAFFPAGQYLVTRTLYLGNPDGSCHNSFVIQGMGRGNSSSVIYTKEPINLMEVISKGKVSIREMYLRHNGSSGSCLLMEGDGFGHGLYDSTLVNRPGNRDDMFRFDGSYIDVVNTGFANEEPEAYAIRCTARTGKININSNIFDSRIWGAGKGLLVDSVEGNRPEGLKVSRNMFLNVGKEQITVKTILHMDVSNNMMDQCSGTTVLVDPAGQSVCGLFLLGNYISPAKNRQEGIGVRFVENECFMLSLHLSNNMIAYSGYGILAGKNCTNLNISNNAINDMAHVGVEADNCVGAVIQGNTFWQCLEGSVKSKYDRTDKPESMPSIANNVINHL